MQGGRDEAYPQPQGAATGTTTIPVLLAQVFEISRKFMLKGDVRCERPIVNPLN